MSSANEKPAAVQFGAGNIGRGFMGELFWASGYRTVFVDVDRPLVDALRSRGAYEVHHITNEGDAVVTVTDVTAIDARDARAVAEAVAGASLVSTAVGVRALQAVTPAMAEGMARRLLYPGAASLNVITCENLLGAGRFMRDLVLAELEHRVTVGHRRQPHGPDRPRRDPPARPLVDRLRAVRPAARGRHGLPRRGAAHRGPRAGR
jgi:mannitol-1-phosphate 5-dehydrogenase